MDRPAPFPVASVSPDASIEALRLIRAYIDRDPAADFTASSSGEAGAALLEMMTALLRALAYHEGRVTEPGEVRAFIHQRLGELTERYTLQALGGDLKAGSGV